MLTHPTTGGEAEQQSGNAFIQPIMCPRRKVDVRDGRPASPFGLFYYGVNVCAQVDFYLRHISPSSPLTTPTSIGVSKWPAAAAVAVFLVPS